MEDELLRLEGRIEHLVYENADTGYAVFELSGGGEVYSVCGVVGEIHVGETVICTGKFETHPTYGKQFRAQTCEADIPHDSEGIYAYLSSGALPYIGLATAKKIIAKFGERALEVIANEPEKLQEIKGLTAEKVVRIHKEFHRMFGVREIIATLARFDISAARAVQVYQEFGGEAVQVIHENPYLLCGEPLHISFKHADKIAAELQFAEDSELRRGAALLYALRHNANNGHTCVPRTRLLETTARFIRLPEEAIAQTIETRKGNAEIEERTIDGESYLYLPDLLRAEEDIAARLADLVRNTVEEFPSLVRELKALELSQGIEYAKSQRKAIEMALSENCFVLTGGPGTGKTTIVNAILHLFKKMDKRVLLCAPTGRAAKRLSELTQHKASTIHRLLEVDYTGGVVRFIHHEDNLLKCDVLILDEMSMVDAKLFQSLLCALKRGCRIIMVGDSDQLPSVGAGNVLGDILKADVVPTVRLSEIFRQADCSLIVKNAHNIVEGKPLAKGEKDGDFFFLEAAGEHCQQLVCDIVANRLPKTYGFDAIRDIQVLCPTKLGFVGTQALNLKLQALLNPPSPKKAQIELGAMTLREGDKVMQTRNNYDIVWHRDGGEQGVGAYNGDIGIITAVHVSSRSITVQMDERKLTYEGEHLIELEIAYAITIHKSQGSEFAAVVIPAADVPARLCYRNLIYTGITRARKLCVVAGQRTTVMSMMNNVTQNKRYSGISSFLREACEEQLALNLKTSETIEPEWTTVEDY